MIFVWIPDARGNDNSSSVTFVFPPPSVTLVKTGVYINPGFPMHPGMTEKSAGIIILATNLILIRIMVTSGRYATSSFFYSLILLFLRTLEQKG